MYSTYVEILHSHYLMLLDVIQIKMKRGSSHRMYSFTTQLCYMKLMCVLLRADSDRAAPHANTAYHGEGVSAGHAGGASAGAQHCACHVPLPGPAHQDTL